VSGPEASGPDLRGPLEAVLFVADLPVPAADLAGLLGVALPSIEAGLADLRTGYEQERRGISLRQVAGGWRLYTSDQYADVVERFVLDGQQARLTQAALETLAVVAYRQPVTRARVAAIRGVGVDGVFRTLSGRGLIEECGSDSPGASAGGAHLYRTTQLFLEKLGLDDVSELPSLAPYLPELDELDDVATSG